MATFDWFEWSSVTFELNYYGQQLWSREKSLEKMKNYCEDD